MADVSQSFLAAPAAGINRPHSSADFRPPSFNSNPWGTGAAEGAPLTHYTTAPPIHVGPNVVVSDAPPPPYDTLPPHTALVNTNPHNYTYYPGDLATSHEFETSRAFSANDLGKKAKDVFGKVLRPVLQPVFDGLASIYLYPITIYIENLDRQLRDGRAKPIPQWLKDAVPTQYGPADLNVIRYGENINIPTLLGGGA